MPKEWEQFNCYKILEILPTASPQEIKSAWKQSSFKHHPDKGGSNDMQVKVNIAYEILSDPISRQAHDIFWSVRATGYSRQTSESQKRNTTATSNSRSESNSNQHSYNEAKYSFLNALRTKIIQETEREKNRIWGELEKRKTSYKEKFLNEISIKRRNVFLSFLAAIGLWFSASYISGCLFYVAIILAVSFFYNLLTGIAVGEKIFSFFVSEKEITKFSDGFAKTSCEDDVQKLSKYQTFLAILTDLILRSSSYDDSEEQIARRLTATFFLMGYVPYSYNSEDRVIVFEAGEDKVIVRFRHRSGIATNITFVEKLVNRMQAERISRGFLFCSPGLSGNAATYANSHSIKWYTLETMNQWITQVFRSDYGGPSGNIFTHLDNLGSFLSKISLKLPGSSSSYRKYRRRW